jgi:hypothetical protein
MKRVIVILLLLCSTARAHIGSPDVFFEGDAGPYKVFVTVRMPAVIPGVAELEVRARDGDVTGMTVVPMRLSGPGSELPPAPDRATRDARDPKMFGAQLWLMEHGALRVRIAVEGARGPATLSVPLRAAAQRTLGMSRTLGAILLGLMLLLATSFIAIAAAAVREGALPPGELASAKARKRTRIASLVAGAIVLALIAAGKMWWASEADAYARMIDRPWTFTVERDGCRIALPQVKVSLLPDHGHEMHLFVVRDGFDAIAHLHPTNSDRFRHVLPSLPAGRYKLFADIVLDSGYPVTGVGELELPADITCDPLTGDDSASVRTPSTIAMLSPREVRAREPLLLQFHASDVEPYMGMAGHAAIVKTDFSVFAHLHPSGSVAMPALMLAGTNTMTHAPHLPDDVSFPYGFPSPGLYKVFVQIKRAGKIDTATFDVTVK